MASFSQYRIFVAVVETGSIAQAAQLLNLSAPAVSKQLSSLEQGLSVDLFHRSHKKLEISAAGKRFYPKCKQILLSIHQAQDELLNSQDAISGPLVITLSKSLVRSHLLDALNAFTLNYPQVEFDIRFSDKMEDLFDENIDFAFRLGKLNDSSHMVAIPLMDTQLTACVSSQYLKQQGLKASAVTRFTNLGNARLISMGPQHQSTALQEFFQKIKVNPADITGHRCDDIEGVHQGVRAGLGIGLLLDVSIQSELASGEFVSILSDHKLPSKRLYLMYKKSKWQSQKHVAFKKHMKAFLA
ncbi:MAG: LysR family transcriptional regulator [Bermanella sp.]